MKTLKAIQIILGLGIMLLLGTALFMMGLAALNDLRSR